jgi:hypothetical protein
MRTDSDTLKNRIPIPKWSRLMVRCIFVNQPDWRTPGATSACGYLPFRTSGIAADLRDHHRSRAPRRGRTAPCSGRLTNAPNATLREYAAGAGSRAGRAEECRQRCESAEFAAYDGCAIGGRWARLLTGSKSFRRRAAQRELKWSTIPKAAPALTKRKHFKINRRASPHRFFISRSRS